MIYVICPANVITGGPDALHQMVFYLNSIGKDAKITYYDENKKGNIRIPEPYKIYISEYLTTEDVCDSSCNSVVIPEMYSYLAKSFRNAKIYIWWLSVNNNKKFSTSYIFSNILKLAKKYLFKDFNTFVLRCRNLMNKSKYNFNNEKTLTHLCASYYAYDYVSHKTKNKVYICIEPISKHFLRMYDKNKHTKKEDVILYNPSKCKEFVEKLSEEAIDLRFIPLKGLNQNQLIEQYQKSKLYIDFGPFPGAERMPKEAVLYGCAIITGKYGASAYYEDVPIKNEYKFDANVCTNAEIISKIREVLMNYYDISHDYDEYRNTVLNLEKNFIKSLTTIF